ncbi:hypothetical protein [Micromonospora carbonacea]|uniref:Uncharacterized protein n=1 Tax=Micromonospora carbonacea TaxID=47853 RepID=A0A1C4YCQ3_9ACTN|nr:hypothetical protein [Micromonospora carbonacea]SCF18499.1 hypothetical protein GA0070563_10610 [Micromonospora carbonacea]
MVPKPGDVLYVNRQASVQFGGDRALIFRVIKVPEQPTYYGWIWLTGYVLDPKGNALDRREIYVQKAGLQRATPPAAAVRQPDRKSAARTTARNAVRK